MGIIRNPIKLKIGILTVEAKTIGQCAALSGIGLGVYCSCAYIQHHYWKKKHLPNVTKQDEKKETHEYLCKGINAPEVISLNQLGEMNCADLTPLVGSWFYAGDIVFLFSIANKGKTIVGIQMAMELANGSRSAMTPEMYSPKKQKVIYYNFEMRKEQLKKRYFSNKELNGYPDGLEIVFCSGVFESVDDMLSDIASRVEQVVGDTTIFIDTITDICPSFFANESAKVIDSLRTIQKNALHIKAIRVTFVLLAHATKKNPMEKIELKDLSGSSNQSNLADSVLAIGFTKLGQEVRYIKNLKARNDEISDKVYVVRKCDTPFLHFEFVDMMYESDILFKPNDKCEKTSIKQIEELAPPEDTPSVPNDVIVQMKDWYQKGVPGHGYKAIVKKYGEEYGLRHAEQVKRLLNG